MKSQLYRITLYSILTYFVLSAPNSAGAASQPSGRNGTHFCGVIDNQWNKRYSDQYPNRRYARSFAANLNVGEPRTVRLIYFLPNNRQSQLDIDKKLDLLMKDVQQSYAEVMEHHGFGRKTFRLETDSDGKAVVHHVKGRFPDAYYHTGSYGKVGKETFERFDPAKNIYLVVLDVSSGLIDVHCGLGTFYGPESGVALIPAPNSPCFGVGLAAHELGHTFGLVHDSLRKAKYSPSSYYSDWMLTSFCAAEWLDVHRYFNIDQTYPEEDELTTIQMLPPIASPPNAIRLRFEITDADRLQQAQLRWGGRWGGNVIACKRLNGQSDVYEFELIPTLYGNPVDLDILLRVIVIDIGLRVIDVHGNFTEQWYPINITALLPPPEVVSIPDANLATAIRETINLAPGDAFTQWNLLKLISLGDRYRQIADLTGLEHATRLQDLYLSEENQIIDISPLAGMANLMSLQLFSNSISDISALAGLTKLTWLNLRGNSISDISALAGMTNLRSLYLSGNSISDISALAGMTNLTELHLRDTPISDISALAGMTNLTLLELRDTPISDISAVPGLTKLTWLLLGNNSISDISALAGMTNLTLLSLWDTPISDISAVAGLTKLTWLLLGNNSISDISALAGMTNLTLLRLGHNSISDISALAGMTNLTRLDLRYNSISDISALAGMTNLTWLDLNGNSISDISTLAGMTNLTSLYLNGNSISDISALAGMTNLTELSLWGNSISDISALVSNAGLGDEDKVDLRGNRLSYTSIHTHIPALQSRGVTVDFDNQAHPALLKISGDNQRRTPGETLANPFVVEARDENGLVLAGISVTFTVTSGDGTFSIQSTTTNTNGRPQSTLTNANGRAQSTLTLGPNLGTCTVQASAVGIEVPVTFNAEGIRIPKKLSIISGVDQEGLPGEALEKAFVVEVRDEFDKPLPGVQATFTETAGGGTLSATSATTDENGRAESTLTLGSVPGTNTVRVSVEGNTQVVALLTIESVRTPMFALSIPAGTHLIHIPLAVNQINGEDATIETVGDLYNALGDEVNFIITVGDDGGWKTYLGDMSAGRAADAEIGDDTGLIAVMNEPATLELVGDALGAGGNSMININVGNNLVGLPLKPAAGLSMISDLLGDGVGAIAVSKADGMGFHTIREPGQDGDGPIVGGVGYLVVYIGTEATSIPIVSSAWENSGAVSAAPAVAFNGTHTPVLYVEGGVMDDYDMLSRIPELRVTVKNLSTGASLDTVLGTELSETAYSGTFVELNRHAAKVGDVLEIVAHSPNPFVGVRPVPQIVVSAEQVLTSRISLPDLELYEIPSETVLLANYPNPFNPETWIPYRLAKAAGVTIEIYDTNGRLVRTIDVGFKPAAVYESRASAIYWDGRNNYGERVASGVYFYHLSAGTYSATRKMLIMK